MSNKICMIIPYYGSLPVYFRLFADSCSFNKQIDFIFFTDLPRPDGIPENIVFHYLPFRDLKHLIEKKTQVSCGMEKPYKVCDYRPAFGLIFEDYISQYEFWGHCDIDIVLGNVSTFIDEPILSNYDIISCRKYWLSGSFALHRNIPEVNSLFKKSKDYKKVFESPNSFAFDETSRLSSQDGSKKNFIYAFLEEGKSLNSMETIIESFTHLIQQVDPKLRVFMDTLIVEDIQPGMILRYCDGHISVFEPGQSNFVKGKEFLHYHLLHQKHSEAFTYPVWEKNPRIFYITQSGFYSEEEMKRFMVLHLSRKFQGSFKYLLEKMKNLFNTMISQIAS